jgi:putative glutamine amidotransferase
MFIPLIGVATWRTTSPSGYPQVSISEAYVRALDQAGACPLLLPTGLDIESLQAILPRLDGVLFTGGGDIAPAFYNAPDHPKVEGVDLERDRLELDLLERAAGEGLPYFGICRGLQLVNVGLGGTLYADILAQRPGAMNHDWDADHPRDYLSHTIEVQPDSRLAGILGQSSVRVNSLHHQGIDRLAPGLLPAACAPDGLIEAVEQPDHPFGLAVQWHPENLTAHEPMRGLFKAFAAAAARRRQDSLSE